MRSRNIGLIIVLLVVGAAAMLSRSSSKDDTAAPAERTASAGQDTVQFDPQETVHKAQLDQMEAGAGAYMERAMHGLLMQGVRSRTELLGFSERTCGAPLKRFLVSIGTPEQAAQAWVHKDAEDVLKVALQ